MTKTDIIEILNNVKSGEISTDEALSLLKIMPYDDLDYAKIDLYSPYILNNDQRPSMIVFRGMEPELFSHFENVFQSVWNDEASTTFIT